MGAFMLTAPPALASTSAESPYPRDFKVTLQVRKGTTYILLYTLSLYYILIRSILITIQSWQQKLSGLNVATFPWDPKPEPVPDMSYAQHGMPTQQMQPMQQPYGTPQQAGQAPHYPQPPQMQPMQQQPQYNPPPLGGPRIKTEPGLEQQAPAPIQNYGGMPNASTAAQRAAQNLQNQYGQRAQASINAMNVGMPQQQGQPQQYQQPMQQQQPARPPGPPIPRPSMTPSQYQQAMAAQAAQQKAALQQTNPTAQYPQTYAQQGQQQQGQQQQNQQGQPQASQQQGQQQQQGYPAQGQQPNQNQSQNQNGQNQGVNNSGAGNGIVKTQVDGGADSEDEDRHAHFGVFKTKGPDGQVIESQVEIDNMLRHQIEARGRAIEGGGLMVEMKEHNKRAAERKAMKGTEKRFRKVKGKGAAQMDAADDSDEDKIKDEDDEDAINSDLDDPDEPADDDEDDEETQWVMLCMYDKVQRVKNKW